MSSYWWKDSFTNISIERQIDAEQDAFCAAVAQQTAQFWATRNPMCFWPMPMHFCKLPKPMPIHSRCPADFAKNDHLKTV